MESKFLLKAFEPLGGLQQKKTENRFLVVQMNCTLLVLGNWYLGYSTRGSVVLAMELIPHTIEVVLLYFTIQRSAFMPVS